MQPIQSASASAYIPEAQQTKACFQILPEELRHDIIKRCIFNTDSYDDIRSLRLVSKYFHQKVREVFRLTSVKEVTFHLDRRIAEMKSKEYEIEVEVAQIPSNNYGPLMKKKYELGDLRHLIKDRVVLNQKNKTNQTKFLFNHKEYRSLIDAEDKQAELTKLILAGVPTPRLKPRPVPQFQKY